MDKVLLVIPPLAGHAAHEIHELARRPPGVAGLRGWVANTAEADQGPLGGGTPCVEAVVCAWVDDAERAGATRWLEELEPHIYLVDEQLQWDHDRDWPTGTPAPGFNRIAFTTKLGSLERVNFAQQWDAVHAPLVRAHSPGVWRYVQNVVVEPLTANARPWDGVAELHFRTVDDFLERMYDSDSGRQLLRADTASFLDVARGERVLTNEWIMLDPPDRTPRFPPRAI
ncbi:MAG: EthD domain-containing protein [Acidimicrobiales bacterium]|nr:EthD domain-containing protein [Acidimicrobiales bacterium]